MSWCLRETRWGLKRTQSQVQPKHSRTSSAFWGKELGQEAELPQKDCQVQLFKGQDKCTDERECNNML